MVIMLMGRLSNEQKVRHVFRILVRAAAVFRASDHLPFTLALWGDRPAGLLVYQPFTSALTSQPFSHRQVLTLYTYLVWGKGGSGLIHEL